MQPIKIKLDNQKFLSITWDDGNKNQISLSDLRKFCPCATCLAERERQGKRYIPIFTGSQIEIKSIKQVGNYAISFTWEDGHETGIYEYPFLRNLAYKVEEKI